MTHHPRGGAVGTVGAVLLLVVGAAAAQSLTAGDIDDHLNWGQYLSYLDRAARQENLPSVAFEDRITLRLEDSAGAGLSNARVTLSGGQAGADIVRFAGSDGIVRLLPAVDGFSASAPISVTVTSGSASQTFEVDPSGMGASREATLRLETTRSLPTALDMMFVIDTTGSMSDELSYLTRELEGIVASVVADHGNAELRFGLTVYRDVGDDYVVREFGFTSDLQTMQGWLSAQRANGGGDYPEAMEQGLARGLAAEWRGPSASRILFLVADAPPHTQNYPGFLDQARAARAAGIHIYPLAASGVADSAEYLMRAAAVMTQGRYLFLTDDSGIGNPHAEPRIACYVVTSLDDLLVRIVASELAGSRVEPSAQDIVRRVGNYQLGVCVGDPVEQTQQPESTGGDGSDRTGATAADASSDSAEGAGGSASGDPAPAPPPPGGTAGDGAAEPGDGDENVDQPGPALALVALALVAVAGLARRRHR